MTQKRILRANARKVVRERGLMMTDAFLRYAKDPDDPEVAELIAQLVEDDPAATAEALFDLAANVVSELVDATGDSTNDVLRRARRA